MLPTTTTSATVFDSPQKKIHNLVLAARVDYDPTFGAEKYMRSAQRILNLADTARIKGDMEKAFINYIKASSIVLEVVTHDKEYNKLKTNSEYIKIKKRVTELFSDTEKIKDLLKAKYESIQEVDASALATAAKGNRPKPPPRPSKPDFLSSSRYDGQMSTAVSPTQVNSSLSAPITPSTTYLSSTSQPINFNQNATSLGALQGSLGSLSFIPSNNMNTSLPPQSLSSYQPLQPTLYGSATPSTSYQPNVTSFPITATSSGLSSSTLAPNINPTTFNTLSSGSLPQSSASPIATPIPKYQLPASNSGAIPNGITRDIRGNPSATPPPSNSVQSTTSSPSSDNSKGSYPYAITISPQRLLGFLSEKRPTILLLDVRMQVQYRSARIKSPTIVNIEPLALRDGVSAKTITDQGLFNNPSSEHKLFSERANFDLVVYYDQNSKEIPVSGPLCNLVRALNELEFEKPLFRKPVFLVGGFDDWLECAGMNWVEGQGVDEVRRIGLPSPPSTDIDDSSSTTSQDDLLRSSGGIPNSSTQLPQSHAILSKISRGGGINRHDGRIIRRNIEDYIKNDDGPQSMVHPSIGTNAPKLPNVAYPPSATPNTNKNASIYPPSSSAYSSSVPSGNNVNGINSNLVNGGYSKPSQYENYSQTGAGNFTASGGSITTSGGNSSRSNGTLGQLQRRQTIYDNHWNNFGGERDTQSNISSAIPGKVPISSATLSLTSAAINASHTIPKMPSTLVMPPAVPPKPMRPLPQTPGMNDLKDYTKFGSGFSKIAGSQLGKTGLTNLGNTCFMNSVIQCLIATPPLSRYFLDGSFKRHINLRNPLGTQGKLADAFSDLIRSMWSGQSLVVSPTSFRYAISGFAPQFKGTEQHDSQEFLSFLLDGLHEDLKMQPQLPPAGSDEGSEADEARMEAMPEYEASEIAWQRYLRRDNSIIVNLFQGQFKNRLCCTKCGKTSTTYNAFMYLALPIKAKVSGRQPQTLASCLKSFTDLETMEGDNAWNCPHCKKPRKATKQLTISRVPDVLLIQLKRFSSDGPFKNKIKAMVQYPIQDLDLTSYLPRRANNKPAEPAIFDLYAVSNHSGEVSSGHYTACVRGEGPNNWINFDDSRVSPCDKSVAVSEHGYTLFYVRKKVSQ
ncbi:ubiquitin-specific protease doa4 [Haplosporangium sp. Z 27]|nr:ubiquitin-specific protease doa4 [Haplosporangium sp. Z 27]